jgi:arginyl-tRNA synthetase
MPRSASNRTSENSPTAIFPARCDAAARLEANPRELAQLIHRVAGVPLIAKAEIAGAGFINFT